MAKKKDQLTSELSKCVALGQWAKAVQALQGLIELEPTNTHYYLRTGDYSLKAGNKAAAIHYYYQAADMFVKAGFSVKGIATYKMILKIAPGETQAHTLMKAINASLGIPADPMFQPVLADPGATMAEPPAFDSPTETLAEPETETESEAEAEPEPEPEQKGPDRPVPMRKREPVSETRMPETDEKKNVNVLFGSLTQDEFGAIVDKLEPLQFMDGERIIAQADESDAMYLISRGGAKVVKEVEGQEVDLGELDEGDFFGEASLFGGGPRSVSVFARGETEVLRLSSADFLEVVKRYPRVENVLEEFYDTPSPSARPKTPEVRK